MRTFADRLQKDPFLHFSSIIYIIPASLMGIAIILKPLFGIIALGSAILVGIAIVRPSILLIALFFFIPFSEFVRSLFQTQISLGGRAFILSGAVKEFLIFLALIAFVARKFIYKADSPRKSITYYLVLALLAWMFINVFRNPNPIDGLWGFRNYVYSFGFYFIGYYFIQDNKTAIRIIWAFLFSGAILALVGIIQIYIEPGFIMSPEQLSPKGSVYIEENRVISLLSNPNDLGRLLAAVVLLSFTLIYYYESKVDKLLLYILSAISCVVLFYTLSREAYLSLVVGIFVLSAVLYKKRMRPQLLLIMISLILVVPFLPSFIYQRLATISIEGGLPRLIAWQTILNEISTDLIFGLGTGVIGSFGLNKIVLKGTSYSYTDNSYLMFLVESGFVGLFLLLVLFIYLFKEISVGLTRDYEKNFSVIPLAALSLFTLLLVISFFSESLFGYPESYLFWLTVGYMTNSLYQKKTS